MPNIRLWVYDDCLASAVGGPLDVFTIANTAWKLQHPKASKPLFGWRIESLDGETVTSASGLPIAVDGKISAQRDCDAIMLPGIHCAGAQKLVQTLERLRALYPALRRAHESRRLLAANCSASFLLAEAGLLDGRRATTSWWLERAFRARYPAAQLEPHALLTEHSGILCSGATTAYLNLALRLVERLGGGELSATCARLLLIDADRVSQAPYMTLTLQEHTRHGDELVLRAQRWVGEHLEHGLGLEQLARALAVSERTLIRRFHAALGTTPTRYLQTQRVEVAKGLLETSSLSIDAIAQRIGYADVGSFRKLFTREVRLTPAAYRARFAVRARVPGAATVSRDHRPSSPSKPR